MPTRRRRRQSWRSGKGAGGSGGEGERREKFHGVGERIPWREKGCGVG